MFLIARKFANLFSKNPALAYGFAGLFVFLQCGYAGTAVNDSESLDAGFRQMYNLHFSEAHKIFETWQELHPDDPVGAASNAAAYLFAEFERLHILELDLFIDKKRLKDREQLAPDPKIKIAFDSDLAKADEIAANILARSPNDRDALFARALADGLRGNYAALVENKNGAALDFLKSSRSIAEKLIAIDPEY